MRISVLTENHAGSLTQAEHGLSCLIESEGKKYQGYLNLTCLQNL